MAYRSIRNMTVEQFAAAVAEENPAPAGGAVAAIATALAAGLAGMAARLSESRPGFSKLSDILARLDELRNTVQMLADEDVESYVDFLAALRDAGAPGAHSRNGRLSFARSRAIDVPLKISDIAAECAEHACKIALSGNPRLRADAAAAVFLCHAATLATAAMISENLGDRTNDPRMDRAREAVQMAAGDVERTLVVFRKVWWRKPGFPSFGSHD
jgi:methenyltetrahydrofolate cyclohydrolase